jgi:hypothetical protein
MATGTDTMAAAMKVADDAAQAAKRAFGATLPQKECPRCGGEGHGYFMGGSRPPGTCFRCSGSGKVFRTRDAAAAARRHGAEVELVRLRACYAAVRTQLRAEEARLAELDADDDGVPFCRWMDVHGIAVLRDRLAAYRAAGEAAARDVQAVAL